MVTHIQQALHNVFIRKYGPICLAVFTDRLKKEFTRFDEDENKAQ